MAIQNNQSSFNNLMSNRKNCEDDTLDYKQSFHFDSRKEKLELVKSIVAFANWKGGVIVFGVTDDFKWEGLDESSDDLNAVQIEDTLRQYTDYKVSRIPGAWRPFCPI